MKTGDLPALAIMAHRSVPHWMGLLCLENKSTWESDPPHTHSALGKLLQERNTSLLESLSNVVLFNDKHFSTAAPVEHHMAKTRFFFSLHFFLF